MYDQEPTPLSKNIETQNQVISLTDASAYIFHFYIPVSLLTLPMIFSYRYEVNQVNLDLFYLHHSVKFVLNISILKCIVTQKAKENSYLELHGNVNFLKFISLTKQTVSLINGKTHANFYNC